MLKGERVESYRITPEMKAFLSTWKKHKRVEDVLRSATLVEQARMKTLTDLWEALSASYEGLGQAMPRDPIYELEGMDFPSEPPSEVEPSTWD